MSEGFCIPCRQDSPATPDCRCAVYGHVLIPPSWSRKGEPYPWPERPDGWSWSPPVETEAKAASPTLLTVTCAHCSKAFTYRPRGGVVKVYCPGQCKNRAASARQRERARQAKADQAAEVAA